MSEYYIGDIVQRFDYDVSLCNLCGVCVSECEFNALSIQNGRLYFNPCRCRRCESCEDCPSGAMSIRFFVVNEKPMSVKDGQERWWEVSSSCVATCDGLCGDCNGKR